VTVFRGGGYEDYRCGTLGEPWCATD
jgi:hypothetical protein